MSSKILFLVLFILSTELIIEIETFELCRFDKFSLSSIFVDTNIANTAANSSQVR